MTWLLAGCASTSVSPFAGPRWIVGSGHAYHAVSWDDGPSEETSFLGDFLEEPTLAAGATVAFLPPEGEGGLAPYVRGSWSQVELNSNAFDFAWGIYGLAGGARWLFVDTPTVDLYGLGDVGLTYLDGTGTGRVFRDSVFYELEAESLGGWTAGGGLGGEVLIVGGLGLGLEAAYRYHRAGGLYFGTVDGTLHAIIRF